MHGVHHLKLVDDALQTHRTPPMGSAVVDHAARVTERATNGDTQRIEALSAGERAELGGAGFRTFMSIADKWELKVAERTRLLGDIAESTYHKWQSGKIGELSRDQLERLSLLLGIYKALRLIFSDEETGTRWLRGVNSERLFAMRTPLARMLDGSIDDLYAVRRYLDAWRGGWP